MNVPDFRDFFVCWTNITLQLFSQAIWNWTSEYLLYQSVLFITLYLAIFKQQWPWHLINISSSHFAERILCDTTNRLYYPPVLFHFINPFRCALSIAPTRIRSRHRPAIFSFLRFLINLISKDSLHDPSFSRFFVFCWMLPVIKNFNFTSTLFSASGLWSSRN